MRVRDTFDVICSAVAVVADAAAVYYGFALARWIRFDSGWIPLFHEGGHPPRSLYVYVALLAMPLFLFIFRSLQLYVRPQLGTFSERIPRLVRAVFLGILIATALAFAIRTEPPLSRITVVLAFFTVSGLILLERFALFRVEYRLAKRRRTVSRVAILGTDEIAARLKQALEREPRLRARVTAFLRTGSTPSDPGIDPGLIRGDADALGDLLKRRQVDQVILSGQSELSHQRMADIILDCEQALVDFKMVPDLYRMLTIKMETQTIDGIPVLGTERWPLDYFWNRAAKRIEDVVGALVGLVVSAPIIAVAALAIRRESPGPVFYRQVRCGEKGRRFRIIKLRSMPVDAEKETGPVWAEQDDARRTRVGAFLRAHNLDELPQFWNVLKGQMSLVGPRPERPHFVEQFKEDIGRYMWRHVSKPGMTGWAQVNGLRGNTDLTKRVEFDLYYLENWSLALDFKIIARTFFTRKNAY
jgi:exopolysaccharide biosynthesis polyprenyl glycosylphosphotransferase